MQIPNLIQELKTLVKLARRKPKTIITKQAKPKPLRVVAKPIKEKREQLKAVVDGRELTLSQIALFYNLEPHTVYARYRVGNRGRLLIRPSQRKSKPTGTVQLRTQKPK
jgi:hypothetical protein